MFTLNVCVPVCEVKNSEIYFNFLTKPFLNKTKKKKTGQECKDIQSTKSFRDEIAKKLSSSFFKAFIKINEIIVNNTRDE